MKHRHLLFFSVILFSFSIVKGQTNGNFFPDLDGKVSKSYLNDYNNANQHKAFTYSPSAEPLALTLYSGFPVAHTYAYFSPKTGPIYCNMDSDPELEIVFAASQDLYAINMDTTSVPGWPKHYASNNEIAWAPSYGDIDGDGQGEIVVGVGGTTNGYIYAYKKDGTICPGFRVTVGKYPMSPTLADVNNDGVMEIVYGTRTGQVFVYKGDGTILPGWPKWMDRFIGASIAVGDINNDGNKEIVAESRNLLWVWDKNGNVMPGFPYAILDSLVGSTSYSAPVIADIDNDGNKEIIFSSHSDSAGAGGITYVVKNNGTSYPGWPKTVPNWIYSAPIVADVNNDGFLEIFTAEYVSSATPMGYIYGYTKDGNMLPNFPIGPLYGSANQLLIADIDNDGQYEIVADQNVQFGDLGRYEAFNMDGTSVTGFPIEFSKNSSFQQPLLGDLNNDNTMDLIGASFEFMGTYATNLFAWNTSLPYASAKIVNKMYQFNAQHDGFYVAPAVIPVELVSFTSSIINNGVVLNWQTATEKNNKGFEIERKTANSNWQVITFIQGNGTSIDKHFYTYTEKNIAPQKYNYRLKQIDFNGTFEYSKEIEADINSPVLFSLGQNYPNPFNPSTVISYQLPKAGYVTLKVYDVLGKEVVALVNEYKSEGRYNVNFDASRLTSGVYVYQLKANEYLSSKKMILTK